MKDDIYARNLNDRKEVQGNKIPSDNSSNAKYSGKGELAYFRIKGYWVKWMRE